jgi:DNA-binding SARP family transcriptional activator
LLLADSTWLQVNPAAHVWADVSELESAYEAASGIRGEDLDARRAAAMQRAIGLYTADMLEGWYQDWCMYERERLKAVYLLVLEKLLAYHEQRNDLDRGLECGERILRCDRAHERTHRRLMRLRYAAGDRTGAIRQYTVCAEALREELDVAPSVQTTELLRLIRSDSGSARFAHEGHRGVGPVGADVPDDQVAMPLERALAALSTAEGFVEESLRALRDPSGPRHPG